MSIRRVIAALAIGIAVTGLAAAPALGHASQVSSSPQADAVLDTAPSEVRVEFESALMETGAALVVTGADGQVVSGATPMIGRTSISVDVDPQAPPGAYTVAYRVVSEDGHTITSTYSYTVASNASGQSAATAAPTSAAATATATEQSAAPAAGGQSGSGVPLWVWIVGAVGALAILGAVFAGRRRS